MAKNLNALLQSIMAMGPGTSNDFISLLYINNMSFDQYATALPNCKQSQDRPNNNMRIQLIKFIIDLQLISIILNESLN